MTSTNGPVHVTTADDLVRMMLDKFASAVGEARMRVPAERGLTFYEIVILASIVEREAVLDEERPLIAGVYQNRLDGLLGSTILNADPTIIYAKDTMLLREEHILAALAVQMQMFPRVSEMSLSRLLDRLLSPD